MDFKARFKGKCSVMQKDGIIGMVKMPSAPVSKQQKIYTEYNEEPQYPKQTYSQVFTNIQTNPKQQKPKFLNNAEQVLQSSQIDNKAYFDMDEYEIVAIPRRFLGQINDKYAMTHSFAPIKPDVQVKEINQTLKSPLVRTAQQIQINKPQFVKQSSERFAQERRNYLMNAGIGSLRNNSYSKKK